LLHFALLLIQLVLSLLLLLQLSFKLLLSKRLLIAAAFNQGGIRQRSTRVRWFGVHRVGENAQAEQQASSFHHGSARIRNAPRDPRPVAAGH
jgi:hypothetical protein